MDDYKGTASTRAKNRYNSKAYDRLYPYVKKGKKAKYEEAAAKVGKSLNEFIETTMDEITEKILNDTKEPRSD